MFAREDHIKCAAIMWLGTREEDCSVITAARLVQDR